jgi:anaphase-promoting complex subunit 4
MYERVACGRVKRKGKIGSQTIECKLSTNLCLKGQKRWEKAVSNGYENIRRLVHENLMPAMQRFAVLVSRLRGLARFQENMTNMGLSTAEQDRVLDTLNCLQLLARFILITADNELHSFTAFALWLKTEIEIQGTSSSSAEDAAEQDRMLDYATVLEYIQGPMLRSELVELFAIQSETDARRLWDPVSEDVSMYEPYKVEVKACVEKRTLPEKRFPGLEALLARLDKQCKGVFEKIAEAQARKVKFGLPIRLGVGRLKSCAIRMVMEVRPSIYIDLQR